MRATLPLLENSDFPPIRRTSFTTLQINVGYLCNQSCLHCHVNAGPKRKEQMDRATADVIIEFLRARQLQTLDITGGAPEMNANFRRIVEESRQLGLEVIDRCNLTVLSEPGYEDLDRFLAAHRVRVVASMPCYLEKNVDSQRGKGVFARSIAGLEKLNALGYGHAGTGLKLDMVFNPQGPTLPPPQALLEGQYKSQLERSYGIVFNDLLTLTNLPVGRFGATLQSRGEFASYMSLLKSSHSDLNLHAVMCRSLISVDWQGFVYDCDFNQMLGLPLRFDGSAKTHLKQLMEADLEGRAIVVRDHCYGCTAGQGSSCGGALITATEEGLVA